MARKRTKLLKEKHDEAKQSVADIIFHPLINLVPVAWVGMGLLRAYVFNSGRMTQMIPIWLFVAGALHLLNSTINLIFLYKKKPSAVYVIQDIIFVSMVGCLVVKAIYVYGSFGKVNYDDPTNGNCYCDKHIYIFSFISETAAFFLYALACCCLFAAIIC